VFAAAEDGTGGHLAIDAVAGSGKTTTLVELAARVSGETAIVAFSKKIERELSSRVEGVDDITVMTTYSAGYSAVRAELARRGAKPGKIDAGKYGRIVRRMVRAMVAGEPVRGVPRLDREAREQWGDGRDVAGVLARWLDLARLTVRDLADEDAVIAVAGEHGLLHPAVYHPAGLAVLRAADAEGEAAALSGALDFSDMIVVPWRMELPAAATYSWVMVDEAQDLSPPQRAIVRAMLRPGGRLVAVGDPHQAIFAFAGASSDSWRQIVDDFRPRGLPLSVCYRCARSIVEAARAYVPHLEPRADAPEGVIRDLAESALPADVRDGDMVVCRTTAPLVTSCLRTIAAGKPAAILGRDIGAGLAAACEAIRDMRLAGDLPAQIAEWERQQREIAERRGAREFAMIAIADRADTLRALAVRGVETWDGVMDRIADIFSDDRASVTFATIHRAKGLEADRVYWLRPELVPHPMARGASRAQEDHLAYIAITRAMRELVMVAGAAAAAED
jgi:DNA helicase-2/ATP-dependent DNA helicase PcrA